jgi:sugar phosphate isomerase/epimerase
MMKLGFVSALFGDLGLEEVLSFASEKGFACVELMCWPVGKAERRYAGVTHIDVADLGGDRIASIRGLLKTKGVEISGLGYYPNALDADLEGARRSVEHIRKVITASRDLGVGVMNTFIGRDHTRNVEYNLGKFREVWPPIVKHAETVGIRVAIENCPMFFTGDEWPGGKNLASSPAIWRKMFEHIPSPHFGLNYDPSHLLWQHMDYVRPLYEFRDRIFHVHIKDAKILRERLNDVGVLTTPLEYHLPKLPGLGEVDWGAFFSALTDIRYDGPVCIEVEDRAFEESLEARKASLVQSRAFVKQFLHIE